MIKKKRANILKILYTYYIFYLNDLVLYRILFLSCVKNSSVFILYLYQY